MLDKTQAKKLVPLVNNPQVWEPFQAYLQALKSLELQVLAVATSELEMFRSQGKVNSLVRLEQLRDEVKEALEREE
tara:strand:+ start:17 stop:244 length:228 start_codon:yes stop_codon:yes gene_type:complete